jgi:hypothetical protein
MQETRVVKGDPKHGYWRTGRRWWGFLAHRWPTALGVAIAAMTAFDLRVDAEFISSLSAPIGEVLEHPRTGTRGVMDLELGELPLYEIECIDSVCC